MPGSPRQCYLVQWHSGDIIGLPAGRRFCCRPIHALCRAGWLLRQGDPCIFWLAVAGQIVAAASFRPGYAGLRHWLSGIPYLDR